MRADLVVDASHHCFHVVVIGARKELQWHVEDTRRHPSFADRGDQGFLVGDSAVHLCLTVCVGWRSTGAGLRGGGGADKMILEVDDRERTRI
jgi:hypothetical protein